MSTAVSGLIAPLVTALVLAVWLRRGRHMPLDVANGRSLHTGAVPRIGGIGIAVGVAASLLPLHVSASLAVTLLVAAGLFLFSLLDDWRSLPVLPRLLVHLAAAFGVTVTISAPWTWMLPSILVVTWMTNLYNFMDGADGLAGGMTVIGFGAYGIAALSTGSPLAPVCFAIAGSAAAFLIFNFPPAKVFMGDAGSVPLGFLAASLGVLGWREGTWAAWFPVLVFSPFVVDATVTLWRRLLRGERIWQAHRDHCYQRLILTGWSHRRLALVAWILMVFAALTALAVRDASSTLQGGALLTWAAIYAVAVMMIVKGTAGASPGRA
jgi:UDP-N-acetylmuramyl pentapeptide phosphotransferase/UDP-N-acetylglucosamine-1-phosphate transferase